VGNIASTDVNDGKKIGCGFIIEERNKTRILMEQEEGGYHPLN